MLQACQRNVQMILIWISLKLWLLELENKKCFSSRFFLGDLIKISWPLAFHNLQNSTHAVIRFLIIKILHLQKEHFHWHYDCILCVHSRLNFLKFVVESKELGVKRLKNISGDPWRNSTNNYQTVYSTTAGTPPKKTHRKRKKKEPQNENAP